MHAVDSRKDEIGTTQSAGPPARRGRVRRIALAGLAFLLIATVAAAGGFFWFLQGLPSDEVALDGNADAIVVLTGGSSRVIDGIELLAGGRGQRLLITGVHKATNAGEISRVAPDHEQIVRCCVDLDRSAMNTLGNAVGTRRWVRDRGFRSLIVVTSGYHMPRAVAELSHQLPDVTLIPFPVVTERLRAEPWWASFATAKLLLSEYAKYLYALVRMRLYPGAGE